MPVSASLSRRSSIYSNTSNTSNYQSNHSFDQHNNGSKNFINIDLSSKFSSSYNSHRRNSYSYQSSSWFARTTAISSGQSFQTIEQMLNNENQIPFMLYIRNYNEYRRHRPAEARLAARKQARAKEIRLRLMERQQKEIAENESSDRYNHSDLSHANHQGNGDHISMRCRNNQMISRESDILICFF
ncbi:hypothetical protein SSS_02260 [Sarcoptes scabiei]|nr:hypothetical protein SSS_02260 [Sarcoptes scabiei]